MNHCALRDVFNDIRAAIIVKDDVPPKIFPFFLEEPVKKLTELFTRISRGVKSDFVDERKKAEAQDILAGPFSATMVLLAEILAHDPGDSENKRLETAILALAAVVDGRAHKPDEPSCKRATTPILTARQDCLKYLREMADADLPRAGFLAGQIWSAAVEESRFEKTMRQFINELLKEASKKRISNVGVFVGQGFDHKWKSGNIGANAVTISDLEGLKEVKPFFDEIRGLYLKAEKPEPFVRSAIQKKPGQPVSPPRPCTHSTPANCGCGFGRRRGLGHGEW